MSLALANLGALHAPARPLLEPARLFGPASIARAQVSSRALALGADGATWGEFGADAARYHGTARRLLVEGQRSNSIRNPRAEGALAGTPGTAPNFWSISGAASGINREIVGVGTENGIPYVDVRFNGTNTLGAIYSVGISGEGNTALVAAEGQVWTGSAFVKLAGGSLAGLSSVMFLLRARNSGGTQIGVNNVTITPTVAALATQRRQATLTMPTGTAFAQAQVMINIAIAASIDVTLRVGALQQEVGAFASSPILPVSGSPAASTRGADMAQATLAALGLPASGACTLLMGAMLPQAAPSGAIQTLLGLDNGTTASRFHLDVVGTQVILRRVTAGVEATLATDCPIATPFRIGATLNGAGQLAASVNGAAVLSVAGGPTTGLTHLRLGQRSGGVDALFGEVGLLRVLPFAVSNAALRGLVASLPG